MFGKNAVVTQKDFIGERPYALKVTSIFYTLQGEGPYAGRRAIFVRLTGCNLTCSFCDTYFNTGEWMTYQDILRYAQRLQEETSAPGAPPPQEPTVMVITGGEPLLQGANLTSFLHKAIDAGYTTQIETNGTVFAELPLETCIVISPKVNERTGNILRVEPRLLEKAHVLKFVVSPDRLGYNIIPDWAFSWVQSRPGKRMIYVSPMAEYAKQPEAREHEPLKSRERQEKVSFWKPGLFDKVKMQRNHEFAAEVAMRDGVRLSLQMHIFASLA